MTIQKTKKCNSRGNWWHEGDVCKEEGCDTLIDSCDNEYTYHAKGQRIIRCRGHYDKLHRSRQTNHYQLNNAVHARAIKKAGGQAAYEALPKNGKERKELRAEARAEIFSTPNEVISEAQESVGGREIWQALDKEVQTQVLDSIAAFNESAPPEPMRPAKGKIDNVIAFKAKPNFTNSYEEVTTVSKGRKRDQKVVSHIRDVYDTCSVEGCDYPLYDVAHIHALKHGADDLPGNCIPLCPNHHRDLDRGRLLLADPSDRSATDPIYFLMGEEEGRIILDEIHDVDSKYIEGCIREIDEYLSKRESC